MIAGTKADTVTAIIEKSSQRAIKSQDYSRHGCKYIVAKKCFPNATRLPTDSMFKLALEALQEIRIKYRWQAIDQENEAMEKAKKRK
jgi:hypothetical protein